jgi:hypothetical protein
VPHIPPCATPNTAWCDPTWKDNSAPYHHGTEIRYPEVEYQNGVMCDYRECTHDPSGLGEDYSCSQHVQLNSIADHSGYFNVAPPKSSIQSSFCGLPSAHAHPKQQQLAKPCATCTGKIVGLVPAECAAWQELHDSTNGPNWFQKCSR